MCIYLFPTYLPDAMMSDIYSSTLSCPQQSNFRSEFSIRNTFLFWVIMFEAGEGSVRQKNLGKAGRECIFDICPYKKSTSNSIVQPDDLISFGLLRKDNRLTYAGALFADYCPVYNSRLFCTRWGGLTMGAGLMDALDDAEYSANALMLVQNGIDFMRKHYKVMWRKSGMRRVEYPDYPQEALREALVNAIIHRDYSVMGSEVHIDIYDDRIEIISPGGMYDNKPIQELDIDFVPSTRRNPCVADIFQRIDYAERRGSGLKKIRRGYNSAFDRQPKFSSTEFWFKTVLFNLNYGVISDDDDETVWEVANNTDGTVNGGNGGKIGAVTSEKGPKGPKLGPKLGTKCNNGTVNGDNYGKNSAITSEKSPKLGPKLGPKEISDNQLVILKYIEQNQYITTQELSAAVNISERKIRENISKLKAKGRIKRIGTSRGRGGHWEIIETG